MVLVGGLGIYLSCGTGVFAQERGRFDASEFDRVLQTYVNDEGKVDYRGLGTNRADLDHFLRRVSQAKPEELKDDAERLAFWINAYNAETLAAALDSVYGKTDSVQKVPGFFDKVTRMVAGKPMTLDQIEKAGRELHDPRIHFSIVCASASCPKLARSVYSGENLEQQLKSATLNFFGDTSRGVRAEKANKEIYLSPIFKWYAGDFVKRGNGTGMSGGELDEKERERSVLEFIAANGSADLAKFIRDVHPTVKYIEYDWSLNAQSKANLGSTR